MVNNNCAARDARYVLSEMQSLVIDAFVNASQLKPTQSFSAVLRRSPPFSAASRLSALK
jgi:hypothetical protein